MDYMEKYRAWLADPAIDEESKKELRAIETDEKEIRDRFYQDLKFGTAGLRGKLGAGSNRMNRYTVSLATEGFARVIQDDGAEAMRKGVVISYDVRNFSKEFAQIAAEVFAAHDIKVYLCDDIQPTPVLSYLVRALGTHAGVMITASHNPKEYNGYKAYGPEGSQILDDWADRILNKIAGLDGFSSISQIDLARGLEEEIIEYVDHSHFEDYRRKVLDLAIHDDIDKSISIVYSPLNGCGYRWVPEILSARSFDRVHIVEEQSMPDGNFTTVGYPNPEDPNAFDLSLDLGDRVDADLLIATDPDADRVAIEVRDIDGSYRFINGNKIGSLLVYYLISELEATGRLPENGAVIKSIVTGDIAKPICEKHGLSYLEVLTGFKNIAAPINAWDRTGEHSFVFGYEESIGFNRGEFVRDKDAVSSTMLIAEMAAFYKKQGKSLLDVLEEIYEEFGYYNERLISIVLEGLDGQQKIGRIMEEFRANPVQEIEDLVLVESIDYQKDDTGLAKSNVLKYRYNDKSWFAIRPSGTEPKIKLYIYSVGKSLEDSEKKLKLLEKAARSIIDRIQ